MEVELEGDRAIDRAVILDRLEYALIGVTTLDLGFEGRSGDRQA